MRLLLACVGCLVLLGASSAEASSVGLERSTLLVFRAAPGEANILRYLRTEGLEGSGAITTLYRFFDDGSKLSAGAGCRNEDAYDRDGNPTGEVVTTCSVEGVSAIEVLLGDGDDSVYRTEGARVFGGSLAVTVPSVIDGEAGKDFLRAADGELRGGPITLSGGDGNDTVEGPSRSEGVLIGGPGADGLTAGKTTTDLRTKLDGGPGNDVLDTSAALGPDDAFGGEGDDMLVMRDLSGAADALHCGPGVDDFEADPGPGKTTPRDSVDPDCEGKRRAGAGLLAAVRPTLSGKAVQYVSAKRNYLILRAACAKPCSRVRATGTVKVGAKTLGKLKTVTKVGTSVTLKVKIPPKVLRRLLKALRAGRPAKASVKATALTSQGKALRSTTKTIRARMKYIR